MENGKHSAAYICSTTMINGVKKRSIFFSNLRTLLQLFSGRPSHRHEAIHKVVYFSRLYYSLYASNEGGQTAKINAL